MSRIDRTSPAARVMYAEPRPEVEFFLMKPSYVYVCVFSCPQGLVKQVLEELEGASPDGLRRGRKRRGRLLIKAGVLLGPRLAAQAVAIRAKLVGPDAGAGPTKNLSYRRSGLLPGPHASPGLNAWGLIRPSLTSCP